MFLVHYCLISVIVVVCASLIGADGPDNQYLPPKVGGRPSGGGKGYQEEAGEPANYNFEYMVQDDASGNDFGHKEMRDGDVAQGTYYVVLPDGRKQTVEYTADSEGYKPKITYADGFPAYQGGPAKNEGYKY